MFALLAFGSLFGFTGLIMAVPVAAAAGVILRFQCGAIARAVTRSGPRRPVSKAMPAPPISRSKAQRWPRPARQLVLDIAPQPRLGPRISWFRGRTVRLMLLERWPDWPGRSLSLSVRRGGQEPFRRDLGVVARGATVAGGAASRRRHPALAALASSKTPIAWRATRRAFSPPESSRRNRRVAAPHRLHLPDNGASRSPTCSQGCVGPWSPRFLGLTTILSGQFWLTSRRSSADD